LPDRPEFAGMRDPNIERGERVEREEPIAVVRVAAPAKSRFLRRPDHQVAKIVFGQHLAMRPIEYERPAKMPSFTKSLR